MDVGVWLRDLGLGQYESNFRDNKINAALLTRLTNDDLKDIGVSALGDRLQLLDAIAVLAGAKPPTDARVSQPAPAPPKAPELSAERRPITVMFCDLVGSTNLAAKLDAEDWRNLVNAYLDETSRAVAGLGGHVLKKLGDGLMALFGYPRALENDAERAVRAALAIQRALEGLNARNAERGAPSLSARIGLDSGPVVVDSSGEVFGEAPNIAARVQGLAEPGSVLVTATVQRQTAGLFVAEDRGPQELKGATAPVTLYRIVRASGGGRRGGVRALTPLVAREEELDLLQRRWERARNGEGQLALIVGEPGIGKSRLIEEFHVRLGETPHTWIEWSSSQLLQNTPLHPFAEWGRQRFGAEFPAEQRLADLEGTLRLVGLDPAEYAPLIAPIADIPLPTSRVASLPPEELRRRQLAAIVDWILAGARSQAVALAVEDLHWADPTSLDLLQTLAERGRQAPLFLIATARPEFRPPWSLRSHHSVVSLSPLDRAEVECMVGGLAQRQVFSKDVIEDVSERTGGVPLFVEEVTRLLLERGVEGGAHAIPPTLQQSLAARLDRLGEAREIAQIGAVLGRGFSQALLEAVAGLDVASVQTSLERLVDADLLFVEGASPQATYRFKHALIQDAAYESLLKSRRQPLHRRAADVLRESGAEPETIAYHFTEAGLDDLAIEWWGKAGDLALRRSAFQEAIAHLGKAIAMADKAGGGKAAGASGERRQLHVAYGNALIATRGYGARETTEVFARVRESAFRDKDAPERLAADYGLWVGSLLRGELSAMKEHSTAFLNDVEANPDFPEAGVAHRTAGITHWFAGEYVGAREHLERALAIFQPGRDDDLAFRFGQDAGVAAMLFLAMSSWALGELGRAASLVRDAEARIAGLAHIGTRAFWTMHAALFALMRGDLSQTALNAHELARLAHEQDLPLWRAYGLFLEGLASAHQSGAAEAGLEDMRRGVELLRSQNVVLFDGLLKIALAEAEAQVGDVDRALAILDEALATSERTGHRAFEVELHRARGELLKHDPSNPSPAADAFGRAIEIAGGQGTRSFGLRAALSLAKLYLSTNRPADAHAVLAPALEGFSPTAEMPEIAEAQALFAALQEVDEVKADVAQRRRMTQLHAAYGAALISARGYGAPETTEAFERAREAAAGDTDAPERLAAHYGLWAASYARGELSSMRMHAAALVRDVAARPDSPEAGIAHRVQGKIHYFAGEIFEAAREFERALALFEPGRDDDLAVRFPPDPGAASMIYLAFVSWTLGEFGQAASLIERMRARIAELSHAPTLALCRVLEAFFGLMRGDRTGARTGVSELARIVRDHDLPLFSAFGEFLVGWATLDGGALADGLEAMRHGAESLRQQNVVVYDGLVKIALVQAEARAGDLERALKVIEEALATCNRMGYRAYECELHRARGGLLLARHPADPAPAEHAFKTAVVIAQRQGARGYELLAALSLAKLYQSTGRAVDAHAVLAPVLEGFASTPEMPEIAEAQALLTAMAKTEEVNTDAQRRQRRLDLQVGMANALLQGRGIHSPETQGAFERASELVAGVEDPVERLAILYGPWAGELVRGDTRRMLEIAAVMMERAADGPAALGARRCLGMSKMYAGDLSGAETTLRWVVDHYDFDRHHGLAVRFSYDPCVVSRYYLAFTRWLRGDANAATVLIAEARSLAERIGHPPTLAATFGITAFLDCVRRDPIRALTNAERAVALAGDFNLPTWRMIGAVCLSQARADLAAVPTSLNELRAMLAGCDAQGVGLPEIHRSYLAEGYARVGELEPALALANEALANMEAKSLGAFLPEAHRVRGEILLKRDHANSGPAEEAFGTALAVAREQGSRSFGLRVALSSAKLFQSTGRPLEAHHVLVPALEGFSPTPEMPEIAEAQALLAALSDSDELRASAAQRRRRTELHAAYGNALFAARGPGALETTEAFAIARESAVGDRDAPGRPAADYGLWAASYVRGELPSMRTHAAAFIGDVEARPDSPEACVAHRVVGSTHWFAGEYHAAQEHLEQALALFQPGRDDDLAYRFGVDAGVAAMLCLGITLWPLGDVGRANSLVRSAEARIAGLAHIGTHAYGNAHLAWFELMSGDLSRAAREGVELARLAREHDQPFWRAHGVFFQGLATAGNGAPGGLEDVRRGVELLRDQNVRMFDGLLKIALAEAEARAGDANHALALLDEALTTYDRTGHRAFEAELHRVRGEMLRKRGPANHALAQQAFQTAITVAKRQSARSFELRAALAFAKLYQSTGRRAEAHAVLTPVLEGFPAFSLHPWGSRAGEEGPPASVESAGPLTPDPSPDTSRAQWERGDAAFVEMPELREAVALLAALVETDDVKADAAQRQRLGQLQVAFGNALMAARGFSAPETAEAFAKARALTTGEKDAPERLAADFGLWAASYTRGDLPSMRAHAADFLADVAARPDSPEAGVAHRIRGITHWFAGEFLEARDRLERALALFQPGRDDDLAFRFGMDPAVSAMAYLAFASWSLGEVDRAVSFVESMNARVGGLTHANTLAIDAMHAFAFQLMRGDRSRARTSAVELARIVREHDLRLFRAFDEFFDGWATADAGALADGLEGMRRGAKRLREQNALVFDGLIKIALSGAEARVGDLESAIAILDEALATVERAGFRAFEAELRRTRGEHLLKRSSPSDPASAEEAFQGAITVARRQSARSFELRAALSLAKLYQSTARPAKAYAVLAPALEGFAPTPEMPEIAEAEALLQRLA